MLLNAITNGFANFDLVEFLINLLLDLPAFVLALSVHEAAHAFVAYRCGDPTAKMLGRLTLNPLKHLDPYGFAMLFIVGLGWAKPVPVNPNNFRHPRRDDFCVSIAGISANLLMFVLGCAAMFAFLTIGLRQVPQSAWHSAGYFITAVDGENYGLTVADVFRYATAMREYLIAPFLGSTLGYLYEMVVNFAVVNLVLALFNLLPVPPLDGYHVFNDLLFRRQLFAPAQAMRIGQGLLLVLAVTGWLSKGLGYLINGAFDGVGSVLLSLYQALKF